MRTILVCLLMVASAAAQAPDAELLKRYQTYTEKDTVRCNILLQLIDAEEDFNVWIKYNNELEAITAAQLKKRLPVGLREYYLYNYGNSQYNKAYFQTSNNDLKAGIISAKRALYYHRKVNKYPEISSDLNILAYNHQHLGFINQGLYYFGQSIKAAEKANDEELLVTSLHNLSEVYLSKSNYKKGIALQFRILKIAEKNKNQKDIADCLATIGAVYLELNDPKKSRAYLNRAFAIQTKIGNQQGIATVHYHLAELARREKNFQSALAHLFQSSALENGSRKNQTFTKIGQVYHQNKDYEQALFYYHKALEIVDKTQNLDDLSQIHESMGRVYIGLKNYRKAKEYLQNAVALASKVNNKETLVAAYDALSQVAWHDKDFEKSLLFFKRSVATRDSIKAADAKNLLLEADFKHETEKKEAQIKALSQQQKITTLENQRQKSLLLIGLIVFVALALIGFLLFNRFKAAKKNELLKISLDETRKTLTAEKKAAESELKALKSQMNPHFIFNALNAIQQEFMYGDKLVANEQMGNFTTLTRQILMVSGKKKITLAVEIDLLEKYLELEKLRFDTDFSYTITVAPDIDETYFSIPPMLLQPLVENCIRHGLLHKKGEKQITIGFSLDDQATQLICVITDNGIGRKQSAMIQSPGNHNSFSTEAIRQRLQLLNPNQAFDNSLVYEDLTDPNGNAIGTRVTLKTTLLD